MLPLFVPSERHSTGARSEKVAGKTHLCARSYFRYRRQTAARRRPLLGFRSLDSERAQMEPMHWQYMGALGGVIGIGWLVVVPMYRGWNHLNEKMSGRVKQSIRTVAECEDPPIAAQSTL